MQLTKLTILTALPNLGIATYTLVDNYQPSTFFNNFNFFTVSTDNKSLLCYNCLL
jgi:hypothetical protein